jgi:hypothetical protein
MAAELFWCLVSNYEHEQLKMVDENRPAGAPSMLELRALIKGDAGLALHD